MPHSEARRHGLYTAFTELLGVERAENLMTYLPTEPAHKLVTKDDLERFALRVDARFEGLESQMGRLESRMDGLESRMDNSLQAVHQRLDRLFLALVAGLLAVVGTLVTAFFAV